MLRIYPWCFILCVSLAGPQVPRYLVKQYSGCVCECFEMRFTFESVDGVKRIALSHVGRPLSMHWNSRDRRKCCIRENSLSLPDCPPLVCWCSPVFGLRLDLELYHWHSCVSSLLIADLGTNWSPYLSKLILYNKYITFICIYTIASVFLENPDSYSIWQFLPLSYVLFPKSLLIRYRTSWISLPFFPFLFCSMFERFFNFIFQPLYWIFNLNQHIFNF